MNHDSCSTKAKTFSCLCYLSIDTSSIVSSQIIAKRFQSKFISILFFILFVHGHYRLATTDIGISDRMEFFGWKSIRKSERETSGKSESKKKYWIIPMTYKFTVSNFFRALPKRSERKLILSQVDEYEEKI